MAERGIWQTTVSGFTLPDILAGSQIAKLISLYNFQFGIYEPEVDGLMGCYRYKNLAGFHHEFDYCAYMLPQMALNLAALDRGGARAKRARSKASMALRIRFWHDRTKQNSEGKFAKVGKVRFYNPVSKQVQKQALSDAEKWLRKFLQPLREDWRQKQLAAGQQLDDIYTEHAKTTRAESDFLKHANRVWYLLHVTDASVVTAHEVACLESDIAKCKQLLIDLGHDELAAFDLNHLRRLYS